MAVAPCRFAAKAAWVFPTRSRAGLSLSPVRHEPGPAPRALDIPNKVLAKRSVTCLYAVCLRHATDLNVCSGGTTIPAGAGLMVLRNNPVENLAPRFKAVLRSAIGAQTSPARNKKFVMPPFAGNFCPSRLRRITSELFEGVEASRRRITQISHAGTKAMTSRRFPYRRPHGCLQARRSRAISQVFVMLTSGATLFSYE